MSHAISAYENLPVSVGQCKGCHYWSHNMLAELPSAEAPTVGKCKRVEPNAALEVGPLAIVGPSDSSYLKTYADFGCVMFVEKE